MSVVSIRTNLSTSKDKIGTRKSNRTSRERPIRPQRNSSKGEGNSSNSSRDVVSNSKGASSSKDVPSNRGLNNRDASRLRRREVVASLAVAERRGELLVGEEVMPR